jgi:GNAT superfamily N-acetyltransferase
MSKIIIRKATIEDLEEIQKLSKIHFELSEKEFDSLWNTNWPFENEGIDWLKKEIAGANNITFVVVENNTIIGFLTAESTNDTRFKNNLKKAEITSLFLQDKFRSQGIGSKLINEFFAWAKHNQVKRVLVSTDFASDAIRFYKKNGFKEYGIELKIDLEE